MTRLVSLFVFLLSLSGAAPSFAWTEVASKTVVADQIKFQKITLPDQTQQYQEVMIQGLSPQGIRILASIVTLHDRTRPRILADTWVPREGKYFPVKRLDGDYSYRLGRLDSFKRGFVKTIDFYVVSLQPGQPAQFKVFLR